MGGKAPSRSGVKTFDFSALHQSMSDIKRDLWESDRRSTSFKRHLSSQHSDFANKILLFKREQAYNGYQQPSE